MTRTFRTAILIVFAATAGNAHVGSPDIYLDGTAGPYKLFVTIRPPQVIPGVAEIQVRSQTPGITEMKAVALPLGDPRADHPPVPDLLRRAAQDTGFFTGALWLMADGSWQVRIVVNGSQGPGTLSIPVPAVAQTVRGMQWPLGVALSIIGLFLVGGLAAICGATVREAKLATGAVPNPANARKGRLAMLVSFAIIAGVLTAGKLWWDREVQIYQGRIYKPINMRATLENASTLDLNLSEPGWMQPEHGKLTRILFTRKLDDLVPDHDHLMHLYVIRQPGLDVIYHLHPDLSQPDEFRLALPAIPPGDYKLYADVVHENGLPETLTAALHLPAGVTERARPLAGDDAHAETTPVGKAALGDSFLLPDGYRMHWINAATPIEARQGTEFRFELLTPNGTRPNDMALYMGMLGHAAFVKTDGTVFAHIHPNGTVSMSAFMLAQGPHSMANMPMDDPTIPNQVAFPYGLPTPGTYRIFVQMKHGETVETGVFDATAH
jgi:hypothetical protein